MNIVKKFGHHVYDLYARYPTKWQAEQGAKEARKIFARVRVHHNVIRGVALNEWFVFVHTLSMKNAFQPAYHKGGVVHTRRIK